MDYPVAVWALLKLGAIVSGANPLYTETELVYQLKISKAKFLVSHGQSYQVALKAAEATGIQTTNIIQFNSLSLNDSPLELTISALVEAGERGDEVPVFCFRQK